jgi:hypothetical protein
LLKEPVDFPADNTSVSGCAPLTGDSGVGALAFNVSPFGPADVVPGSAELGDSGVSGFFEQATARASKTADAHATAFLCCIRKTSYFELDLSNPLGNGLANSTTLGSFLSSLAC